MPSVFYDRTQIVGWLGSRTVAKAREYIHAVSKLRWHDNTLSGKVQGTAHRPYSVNVHFYDVEKKLWSVGECSCPVRFNCKHVAALLIASLKKTPNSQPNGINLEVVKWLENFRTRRLSTLPNGKKITSKPTHKLAYVLGWSLSQHCEMRIFKARCSTDGAIRAIEQPWSNVDAAIVNPPKFVTDEDLFILRGLWLNHSPEDYGSYGSFTLRGTNGADVLQKMILTGRLYTTQTTSRATAPKHLVLSQGEVRSGQIQWQPQSDDRLQPALRIEPSVTMLLTTEPTWYVDAQTSEAGVVQLPMPFQQLADYLSMPPISQAEVPLVASVLREVAPDLPLPPEHDASTLCTIDTEPVPTLALDTQSILRASFDKYDYRVRLLDFATVTFDYDGVSVDAESHTTLLPSADGDTVQVRRRSAVEKQRLLELRKAGLRKISASSAHGLQSLPEAMFGLKEPNAWRSFVDKSLPILRNKGWRVHMTPEFRFNIIEIDIIDGMARRADDGWFNLEMGILVGERTVRLEPLLADLFQRDPRWLSGKLETIADNAPIELRTDRGERLRLRADRLKPVVRILIDLFETVGKGPLRISELDAGRLEALNDTGRWQFQGDTSIRQLAQRLQGGPGLQEAPVPHSLQAELRTYQHQGLSWMQFLREHNLSGVLADDMGLGKTVQTLAHVLAEKEAHRLDRPALIVVPTTLIHNWREEAQRFAPNLKVLDLNGPQRKDRFQQIGKHDLILTTYALLWRDQEVLAKHDYHLLILDEAQYVKNATTRAAITIRNLRARHRLCLTGTPLENHLGELWAQFDFLLPGFLGSQKDFTKRWRTPIEKGGDTVRRELLARRIRPFMLRRRKDEVATELPPKTIIIRTVDLEGAQRDLYETVRATMQKKVRDAVTTQGLARSHIIVLEALLKLRQVCCDPRLVKLKKAAQVKESAKLDLLLAMLPELIDEGRSILLFSQFTGMLSLIATSLNKATIPYVTLTGDTMDRATPVQRFQQGKVPLFLISLKAGGVGLNLTAADTVIHYDPWWNPAVENQATDRAHRLGQDKPVFVYKLIAAGSIEEKILSLQERKALLANSILSEDPVGAVKFSTDDLNALFEPIPEAQPHTHNSQPSVSLRKNLRKK